MPKQSLVDLYDDMDIDAISRECKLMIVKKRDVPVDEMIEILEDTLEIELVVALVDVFRFRIHDIDEYLMDIVYKKSSDTIKRHIITVLSGNPSSKHLQFLIDQYFYNPYMRPAIRSQAFEDKRRLFMNLTRYFEDAPFTKDNVDVAKQILKTIPRDVVHSFGGIFAGTKLLNIYYSIPKDERS